MILLKPLFFLVVLSWSGMVYGAPASEPVCNTDAEIVSCQFIPNNADVGVLFEGLWDHVDRKSKGFTFSIDSKFTTDNTELRLRRGAIHYFTEVTSCKGSSGPIHCMDYIKNYLVKNDRPALLSQRDQYLLKFVVFEVYKNKARERTIGFATRSASLATESNPLPTGSTASGLGVNSLVSYQAGSVGVNELLLNLTIGNWDQSIVYGNKFEAYVSQGIGSSTTFWNEEVYAVVNNNLEDNTKATIGDSFSGTPTKDERTGDLVIENFNFNAFLKNQTSRQVVKESSGWGFSEKESSVVSSYSHGRQYKSSRPRLVLKPGVPAFVLTAENVSRGKSVGKALTGYSRTEGKTDLQLMVLVTAYPANAQSEDQYPFIEEDGLLKQKMYSQEGQPYQPLPNALQGTPSILINSQALSYSPFLEVSQSGGVQLKDYLLKLDPANLHSQNWQQKINIKIWSKDGTVQTSEDTESLLNLVQKGFQFGIRLGQSVKTPRVRFFVTLSVDSEFQEMSGTPMPKVSEVTYEVLHHIKGNQDPNAPGTLFDTRILDNGL